MDFNGFAENQFLDWLSVPDLKMAVAVLAVIDLGLVAQTLFQPAVQNDEEISTGYFINPEFGEALLPVIPIVWKDRIGITPRDRFQRQLYREVEPVGQ